jgi:hypothetical protein
MGTPGQPIRLGQPAQSRRRSLKLTISRDELVRRLAEVSHLTYVRQENRDHGVPLEELALNVTGDDRERAEDIVAELERLGVYQEPSLRVQENREAVDDGTVPQVESKRQAVTDLWGNPLSERKAKRGDSRGGFLRRRSGQ